MTYGNGPQRPVWGPQGSQGPQQGYPQDKGDQNKKTNKKVLKWILIVLGVLVLVSMCTAAVSDDEEMGPNDKEAAGTSEVQTSEAPEPEPEPAVEDVVVPEPEPEPELTEDDIKEIVYLSQASQFNPPSDEDALIVAYATCAFLNTGNSVESLVWETVVAGDDRIVDWISNDDLPGLYGAAIATHCPEHMDQLEAYQ